MAERLRLLLAALLFACATASVSAAAPDARELDDRVMHLTEKLRCLVCQNQSIAESQADLANDLRREVREMLVAGKSDQEIIDYMVQRYGDFVLYDPPFKTSTLLLWGGPAALLLLAIGGFGWTLRQRGRTPTAPLSDTERAAALALLAPQDDHNENKA